MSVERLEERCLLAVDPLYQSAAWSEASWWSSNGADTPTGDGELYPVSVASTPLTGADSLGGISGSKWNDLNHNGVWDQPDEPGLTGWTIFLDTNENGNPDDGEYWTTTGSDGSYSFTGLAAGDYVVAEVMKPGWTQTYPGGTISTDLIVNGGFETGNFTGWTVNTPVNPFRPWAVSPAGASGPLSPIAPAEGNYDAWNGFDGGGPIEFTMYQDVSIATGVTASLMWQDRAQWNMTSIAQPRTVEVQVRNPDDNAVLDTVYSFATSGTSGNTGWQSHSVDLSAYAGSEVRIYFVEFIPQSFTGPAQIEFDAIALNVTPVIGAHEVTVPEGQVVMGVNFGNRFVPPGGIHGAKWNDLNGNGVWDQPDEPGLAGWTIFLDANDNGALDAGESWTTTGSDGSYSFTGLAAGEYVVAEVMKPGWVQTSPGGLAATELIVNGGFKTGSLSGWTVQNTGPGNFVINDGSVDPGGPDTPLPPYAGDYSALAGQTGPSTHVIYQDVAIPTGGNFTLAWADRIRNHASLFQDPSHEYRVEIRGTENQVLTTLFSTDPGDPLTRDWTERNADLSSFAGQTVRIAFVVNVSLFYFNVHIDDVRITGSGAGEVGTIPVNLAAGAVVTDVNFGNQSVLPGEIHGAKWNDLNGNGAWDQPDEPGLAGWTIFLDANENGLLDGGESWTVTGADGSYSFTGLPAGEYVVGEVAKPGWIQTSPGGTDTTALIVNGGFETGSFTGWTVQNTGSGNFVINNGAVDPGGPDGPLPPYEGAYSALSGQSGGGTHVLYQDVAIPTGGNFTLQWADRIRNHATSFQDPSQEYRVEVRDTADVVLTTLFSTNPGDPLIRDWTERSADLSAFAGQTVRIAFVEQDNLFYFNVHIDSVRISRSVPGGTILVDLAAGEVATDVNFGNQFMPPGEIHGAKWNDLNGNGVWDQPAEPGLGGWTIFLDANDNGALDEGESWTITAADGSYSFTGLPAGEYVVAELPQPWWMQTYPHTGLERLFVLRGTGGQFSIHELDPLSGVSINNFLAPVNGSAGPQGLALGPSSLFFIDGNGSSPHTLWELDPDTGAVIDSDVIDAVSPTSIAGLAYLDGKVYAERYLTSEILVWDPVTDSEVIRLTVGADGIGGLTGAADLGLLFESNLDGNVFKIDPDSGMVLATLSPGVGRLTGGLAYIGGEIIAIDSGGTSTAYRIDPTTGAVLGTLTLGGAGIVGGLAGDGAPAGSVSGGHLVALAVGEVATGIDFGNQFVPPGAIYGAKWNDVNGNGVWEQPDEPGLAGWTIFLDTNENGELDDDETWTITAADGSYSFAGLSAGEYVLAEVMQEGWAQTFAPPSITVEPGTNTLNVNFGNIALPPLPGDYNNNGAVDAADYVLWRMALGSMVGRYSGADGSGNGTIGPEDHGVWTANFGNVLLPEAGGGASLVVALAEPASLEINAPEVAEQRTDSSGALAVDSYPAPQRRIAALRQANREWRLESREPRRDVALMAWLAQASAVDEEDREAPDGDDIDEGSRDSYFQSFERAAGAVEDAARPKWFNGGGARLTTLR